MELALLAAVVAVSIYIARQMYGFTLSERIRVTAIPAAALIVYFVVVGLTVGMDWRFSPPGVLGSQLLELGLLHVVNRRPASPAPPVL